MGPVALAANGMTAFAEPYWLVALALPLALIVFSVRNNPLAELDRGRFWLSTGLRALAMLCLVFALAGPLQEL